MVAVLIALMIALQSVSGIVAEREGRLREAERSVAASLAAAQTIVGPKSTSAFTPSPSNTRRGNSIRLSFGPNE